MTLRSCRKTKLLHTALDLRVEETKNPGLYEARVNASALVSGIYFNRLSAGTFVEAKKMIVSKQATHDRQASQVAFASPVMRVNAACARSKAVWPD